MREIPQSRSVTRRMPTRLGTRQHRLPGGEPMLTLRASAIALPFVALAVLIGVLSIVLSVPR
jgi:hypothetical protein